MTPGERQAIKDLIRQFKSPETSDLDAAINVIASHAETIKALMSRLDKAKKITDKLKSELDLSYEEIFT